MKCVKIFEKSSILNVLVVAKYASFKEYISK